MKAVDFPQKRLLVSTLGLECFERLLHSKLDVVDLLGGAARGLQR